MFYNLLRMLKFKLDVLLVWISWFAYEVVLVLVGLWLLV